MFKFCSALVSVIACVACGGSFSAHESGGSAGSGNAGEANGGQTGAAGSSGNGYSGNTSDGGTTSGGDTGSGTAGTAGASAGEGGAAVGGSAGSGPGADCAKLKGQYQALVEKARVCDAGSTGQCSPSSTVEPLSCGCPTLVNAKSEYTTAAKKARQAYQDAKCAEDVACAAIACLPVTEASCAQAMASASSFVCTGRTTVAN